MMMFINSMVALGAMIYFAVSGKDINLGFGFAWVCWCITTLSFKIVRK